jgi:hypothetical protein
MIAAPAARASISTSCRNAAKSLSVCDDCRTVVFTIDLPSFAALTRNGAAPKKNWLVKILLDYLVTA